MKRWMSIILGTVLAAMLVMCMTPSALAAENSGVSIPVTISLSGTLPRPAEDYTIRLRADNASYPMPEGADGDVYTMTITGVDTKNFPAIIYNRVGIYTYTIHQVAGSNRRCTYDDSVYTLIVYITNAEDGSGLEATAVLYLESDGDKLPGVEFDNKYETVRPPIDPPKPTPPDEEPEPPKPEPPVETDIPEPTPPVEPEKPEPEPIVEPEPPETTPPVEPETPEPTPPADPDIPKTGDESSPLLYAGLIAVGIGVIVVLFLTRKTKKSEE